MVRDYVTFTSVQILQLPSLIKESNLSAFKRKTERWFDTELLSLCEDLHTIWTKERRAITPSVGGRISLLTCLRIVELEYYHVTNTPACCPLYSDVKRAMLSFEDLMTRLEVCNTTEDPNVSQRLRVFIDKLSESDRLVKEASACVTASLYWSHFE